MFNTLFIGAGSHSDAVYSSLNKNEYSLIGYLDDKDDEKYNGLPILGKIEQFEQIIDEYNIEKIMITIGDNKKRHEVYEKIKLNHYNKLFNVISKTSEVLDSVEINGRGIFIGHKVFVGAKVILHDNIIINTGTIIEHHSIIHRSCNITPGTVINGLVTINEGVYVGTSSVFIQLVEVAPWCMIGASSTVTKSLETENALYYGTPAKFIRKFDLS